jgi:hypothetical protein
VDVGQLVVDDVEEHDELRPHHAHLPIAHDQVDAVGPLIRTTHAPSNIRRLHNNNHHNLRTRSTNNNNKKKSTTNTTTRTATSDAVGWGVCRTSMAV